MRVILIKATEGEGRARVQSLRPKGPPPKFFSHRRRLENFFMGTPKVPSQWSFPYVRTTENPVTPGFGEGEPIQVTGKSERT